MKDREDDISANYAHPGSTGRQSLVMRVTDSDFQGEVLEKLGRLEAKMDMLVGSGQPGRVKLVEDRITQLESAPTHSKKNSKPRRLPKSSSEKHELS